MTAMLVNFAGSVALTPPLSRKRERGGRYREGGVA